MSRGAPARESAAESRSLGGVALTSLWVAACRALESQRPDALFQSQPGRRCKRGQSQLSTAVGTAESSTEPLSRLPVVFRPSTTPRRHPCIVRCHVTSRLACGPVSPGRVGP